MAKSRYKITSSRINGYPQYPKTIVEAITWDKEKKSLEEVLNELVEMAQPLVIDFSELFYNVTYEEMLQYMNITEAQFRRFWDGAIPAVKINYDGGFQRCIAVRTDGDAMVFYQPYGEEYTLTPLVILSEDNNGWSITAY